MKILIVYATKYGCTQKAVTLLKSQLGENVSSVNIMKDKVPELKEYDTVVLGGSIYIGKIQKQMYNYMLKHAEELKTKRLGLFICAGEQDPAIIEKELKDSFPEELFSRAVVKEVFGGELHIDKISFIEKHMIRIVKGATQGYSNLSEDKIGKFAKDILSK